MDPGFQRSENNSLNGNITHTEPNGLNLNIINNERNKRKISANVSSHPEVIETKNPLATMETPPEGREITAGLGEVEEIHTDENVNNKNEAYGLNQQHEAGENQPEFDVEQESGSQNSPELNNKRIVLQRFTIYNSIRTVYIVGSNAKETLFRILEISKDPKDETNIEFLEDKNYFYTRKDMVELLNGLNESVEGGIYKIVRGYGLLGLIKFTKGYYLSLITKCSQVAILGGHFVYHIDETKLIPLDTNYKRPDKYSDEERFLSIFKYLDLGKTFYFSYSYDITNTLQTNFIRQKKYAEKFQFLDLYSEKLRCLDNEHDEGFEPFSNFDHNERFVWNKLLLEPVLRFPDIAVYEWFQPIIHGFVDQANISIYGRKIYITLIARRSHHFAGARFLKRGVNDKGNVANEIETEQIVTDMLVSSFHDPKYGFFNNPRFTSFVQHRGSIPLFWTQDLNKLPKPPIEINLSDPFYQSSAMHFDNLFQRYGLPVILLNLIKTKEKVPRELKLNEHFINCIKYLNQFLPEKNILQFNSFDMSKNSKKNLDVIGPLQKIASQSILKIGFFHNGVDLGKTKVQKGIIRTNCIDCLDRTNAAQFIIGKEALYCQISSLNLIPEGMSLEYDSDLINILTEIFHDHGDTIAIQYGGSNLVNTMDSYRRINQWSSHTRDMLNSIKRIYSNSFMDLIRQEAINLFLGNYSYDANKPKLWELQNDYYLHNDPLIQDIRVKRSYQHWFNEKYLSDSRFDLVSKAKSNKEIPFGYTNLEPYPDYNDNWFNECYVPKKFQSLTDLFQYNMNSNSRYFPSTNLDNKFDYSPFETRKPTLRATKSSEALSPSGVPGGSISTKYLDNLVDLNDDAAGHENDEEVCKDGVEKFGTNKHDESKPKRIHSSHYLNLTKPHKIRNFLTTKIEKLGYSAYNNVDEKREFSIQESISKPEHNHSEIFGSGDSMDISPKAEDSKLYKSHTSLPTLIPPSNHLIDSEYHYATSEEDRNLYMYFASRLIQSNTDSELSSGTNLDILDLKIYRNYLGVDEDKGYDLIVEDNYI